jgi:hypothetical protein
MDLEGLLLFLPSRLRLLEMLIFELVVDEVKPAEGDLLT